MFCQWKKRTSLNFLLCGKYDLGEGALFPELKQISVLNKSLFNQKNHQKVTQSKESIDLTEENPLYKRTSRLFVRTSRPTPLV